MELINGSCKAELRYEGIDGFKEQNGEVWVFPGHMRLVDDDDTQLRWRVYECSGPVTYHTQFYDRLQNEDTGVEGSESEICQRLQEHVSTLSHKFEALQRLVMAQGQLFSGVGTTAAVSDGNRQCAQVFDILRQKLALLMQKPIPQIKPRKSDEGATFFEDNCTGYLFTEVDCDLDTFQAIARNIKSSLATACFRPSFSEILHPPANLGEAEIVFSSLMHLVRSIGMDSTSDIMHMAYRERIRPLARNAFSQDDAVRVLGTFLFDKHNESSPTALLPCSCIHEGNIRNEVEVLFRSTSQFDTVSRTYKHRLLPKKCRGTSVITDVFQSHVSQVSAGDQPAMVKKLLSDLPTLSLRWRAIPSPNSRTWSRSLVFPHFVYGSLELQVPFVIIRGTDTVQELKDLSLASIVKKNIVSHKEDENSVLANTHKTTT